jgi:hypothetical protein
VQVTPGKCTRKLLFLVLLLLHLCNKGAWVCPSAVENLPNRDDVPRPVILVWLQGPGGKLGGPHDSYVNRAQALTLGWAGSSMTSREQ